MAPFLLEVGVGAAQAAVDLGQGVGRLGLVAGPGQEGSLARDALQPGQAGRGPLIGSGGLLVAAQPLIGAGEGEHRLGRLALLALGAQGLQQLQRLGMTAELHQRLGAAEQQGRIVGVHALGGLGVEGLRLVVPTELGGGGGQSHLVVDGRRQVIGGLGVAMRPHRVQILARGAPDLAGGGAAQQLGQHDGEEIDQAADRREHHQDDPDPEQLAAAAHDVDAHPDQEAADDHEARQAEHHQEAHAGPPRRSWRGSAFSAGASLRTSAW